MYISYDKTRKVQTTDGIYWLPSGINAFLESSERRESEK